MAQYNPMGNPVYQQQSYPQQQVLQNQPVNPQVYQAAAQQQQSQQPTQVVTPEEFQRQVNELAEAKFKARSADVTANAVAAMKGVINNMGLFGNDQQQNQMPQQQQNQSFFDTTWGKVAIGGAGVGTGFLASKFLFNGRGGGYSPSAQELSMVGQALKTLFG